jgi:hypothetical protein
MVIEAGYIQLVEVTTQEQRVLSVLESGEAFDHLPASQVHDFQSIVSTGGHKEALLFQIRTHVIEAPCEHRQRYRLHQPSACFSWADAGTAKRQPWQGSTLKLRHGFPVLVMMWPAADIGPWRMQG